MLSADHVHNLLCVWLYPYHLILHRALGKFESGELGQLKEVLERQGDIRRDPDIQPLWDPHQLLNASRMLSLRSVVPWNDGSGSDDNVTTEDGLANEHSNK